MINKHHRLYDQAFGEDRQLWTSASPLHQLNRQAVPMLLVCSTKRDDACTQSEEFVDAAKNLGNHAIMTREDLSHAQINNRLGLDEHYTQRIDNFIHQKITRQIVANKNAAD
jgi:hypothetical protein